MCVDDVLLVGDFNARVGSSGRQDVSMREGVRGYPGVGKMNESAWGSPFCALNELTHGLRRRSISTHSNIQVARNGTASTM